MNNAKKIDRKRIRELFSYDDEGFLVWNNIGRTHSREGKIVGSKQKSGYIRATVDGKTYNVHRLIYAYHYGDISSDLQIDHIDGVRDNNKISNLRAVTRSENQHNQRKAKGYSYSKRDGLYQARIKKDGKLIPLGCFKNESDARDAYIRAKMDIHPSSPKDIG